jgi:inosose dehydratase
MKSQILRREFLGGLAALSVAGSSGRAYPPFRSFLPATAHFPDFDSPNAKTTPDIRIGYASITWGGNDRQAIDDISALGFPGIQLRANVVKDFQPEQLRDVLHQHGLTMVALSSGDVHLDPALDADDIALHTANAQFLHDEGGLYSRSSINWRKTTPRQPPIIGTWATYSRKSANAPPTLVSLSVTTII